MCASSSHLCYLALLVALGFCNIRVPQAFTSHLLVEDALALMHHEEPLVTMHDNVRMAQDRRPSRVNEEARFARGNQMERKAAKMAVRILRRDRLFVLLAVSVRFCSCSSIFR